MKADLELAEKQLNRNKELLKANGVSQEEVDKARNEVATLEARIREVKTFIDNARIEAPFRGRVGLRQVSPGDLVSQGTSIVRLVQEDPLKLDVSVPGKYASHIHKGQTVRFTAGGSRDTFRAEIYAKEASVDPSTRALKVRARVREPNPRLVPGSYVDATIALARIDSALMVPAEAIVRELNSQRLWVFRNSQAHSLEVETGMTKEGDVRITKGIVPGDTVMITGLLQVKPGMPVRVRNIERTTGLRERTPS